MNVDEIKDIIIARLKYIVKNAAQIANIAQACGDSGDLNREAIDEMFRRDEDLNCNICGLENLLNVLEPKEETDE